MLVNINNIDSEFMRQFVLDFYVCTNTKILYYNTDSFLENIFVNILDISRKKKQ